MWKCAKCGNVRNVISMGLIFFCYRLFKEAINNAVKYSDASLLQLSVHYSDHSVDFAISDNGKEFDITTVKTGNGLMNMKKRANDNHAKFCLQSITQKGTLISL